MTRTINTHAMFRKIHLTALPLLFFTVAAFAETGADSHCTKVNLTTGIGYTKELTIQDLVFYCPFQLEYGGSIPHWNRKSKHISQSEKDVKRLNPFSCYVHDFEQQKFDTAGRLFKRELGSTSPYFAIGHKDKAEQVECAYRPTSPMQKCPLGAKTGNDGSLHLAQNSGGILENFALGGKRHDGITDSTKTARYTKKSEADIESIFSTEVYAKDKSTVNLRDELAKNKINYIDFWSSWCGPCIAEIPKTQKLKDKVDKVGFIYLSVDRDIEKWIGADHKLQLPSSSFCEINSALSKQLDIARIPRYMVLDSSGKILVDNAPWPSDPSTEELLNKLLREVK